MNVIVWTKPICGQCTGVKAKLRGAGVPFEERDLTVPEAAKNLEHFRSLGYTSAPITEYGPIAVPGFIPAEIDRVIDAWRDAQEGTGVPICPECRDGKHRNCTGWALDADDEMVSCRCAHGDAR